MSVVLVCLPGAPKISEEAVKKEEELDKNLETRVEGQQFFFKNYSLRNTIIIKFSTDLNQQISVTSGKMCHVVFFYIHLLSS